MSDIKIFQFAGQQVRTEIINEQPYFLLKDVCEILELGQVAGVKRRLDKDVISNHPLETAGGTQISTFVNEDGLYDVIMDSRKLEAKQFRKWVTSEVLPSIRKHGAYATPDTIEGIVNDPEFGIQLLSNLKKERDEKKQLIEQRNAELPYTNFGRVVSNSDGAVSVGSFAKMLYEDHGIALGRNKLFKWLRENDFLIKHGRDKNAPKQEYIEQGLFITKPTIVSRTEGDVEKMTTLITGKGQVKLADILAHEFMEVI